MTGASGFLGKNFLLASDPSWIVHATFRRADFPDFLAAHRLAHVIAHRCDLTVPGAATALARDAGGEFDAVLHLAANADPEASAIDPMADAAAGPVALASLLSVVRTDRFVYLSSGAVYEGARGLVSPETPVEPSLPYAISKVASEGYVRWFQSRGRIGVYVILRFFAAYGPFEAARRLSTRLARWAIDGAREPFLLRGDGRNLIDSMYVADAARGLRMVTESAVGNVTVDFAAGVPRSINELVERAIHVFGIEHADVRRSGAVAEYQEFHASPRRMRELFKFEPEVPLERGLLALQSHLRQTEAVS